MTDSEALGLDILATLADFVGGTRGLKSLFSLRHLCSFHGDTEVLTDHGFVALKDIKASGYKVWSRNPSTGEMGWQQVLAQYFNPYEHTVTIKVRDIETGAEQTIISNRIHPFFVQIAAPLPVQLTATATDGLSVPISSEGHVYRGPIANGYWVDAANLKPGYRLLNHDQSWAEVVTVEIEEKPLKAYNLTVADWETFFVRGDGDKNADPVWVHNCKWFNVNRLPQAVRDSANETLASINKGVVRSGVPEGRWGHRYNNVDGSLPLREANGNPITYSSYDVPVSGQVGHGANRIITGTDGSRYYTGTHYRGFGRIK